MPEHVVLATEQLGLATRFWRVQSNHLLITHHFHQNCQTHYFHCVLHDQPGHLLPDRQHLGGQPERYARNDHMITVVPGLPGQSYPPCCTSSLYRLVISLVQSNPMGHMLDVWFQSRLVWGRRNSSTPDLKWAFVLSHHIVGQLDMDGVHIRVTNVSVHQICKLLNLFHHTSLDVPVVNHLFEYFVEPWILFQLFRWHYFPFPLKKLVQSSAVKIQQPRRVTQ